MSSSPEGSQFIKNLPVNYFKSLCSSDSLYISEEKFVANLIEKYIEHRSHLPLLDEENPMKDWSHLTEVEKNNRKEEEKKAAEEEGKKNAEEEKKQLDAYNALDELGKIKFDWKKKLDTV